MRKYISGNSWIEVMDINIFIFLLNFSISTFRNLSLYLLIRRWITYSTKNNILDIIYSLRKKGHYLPIFSPFCSYCSLKMYQLILELHDPNRCPLISQQVERSILSFCFHFASTVSWFVVRVVRIHTYSLSFSLIF